MAGLQGHEINFSNQRRLWLFFGRLASPPCQLAFDELVVESSSRQKGPSRACTEDWHKIAVEQPLFIGAAARSGPVAVCRDAKNGSPHGAIWS